jgi:hypothetical protein
MYKHSLKRGEIKKKNFDQYVSHFNEKKFYKNNTICTTKSNTKSNTKLNNK